MLGYLYGSVAMYELWGVGKKATQVATPDRIFPAAKSRGDSRRIVCGESKPLVTGIDVLGIHVEVVRAVGGPTRKRTAIEIDDQESG